MKHMDFIKRNIFNPYFILLLFLILFIVRILYLDADPFFFKRVGDLGDEGFWAYNAKNAILFNRWIIDDFNQALATAPLYSAMVYLSFKLFGLGYFQVRLVSALLGWSTLIVLYFFMKDAWNKKAALISVIILGFNSVFLMYNRLGLVESSMIFFLVLTFYFWYKGNKRIIFYFLSGFAFSLAILTKITVFYFVPVLIIFWIFEKIRKNLKLQNIAYFITSSLIPLIIFIMFVLIPNWVKLAPFLVSVSENQKTLSLTNLILQFHFNNFFGLLPVLILLIPLIIYFMNLSVNLDLRSNVLSNIKLFIIKRDYMEIIALSWLIGGSLGLLFSDLADRRFLILIIPLTIIFTKVILDKSKLNLDLFSKHIISLINNSKIYIRFLLALALLIPICSFLIVITSLIDHLNLIKILIISIMFILFTCLILPDNIYKKTQDVRASIILVSLCSIIIVPLLNIGITVHFEYSSGLQNSLIVWSLIALGIISLYLLISFIWKTNLLKTIPKFTCLLLVIYLIINFTIIGAQLANPTFTIAQSSKSLQDYTQKGDIIIGPWSHELTLGNEMIPIYYVPHEPSFKMINQNISKYPPKFILISEVFDSKNTDLSQSFPKLNEFPNAKFIKRIELFPYTYTNKYRVVLYLYKLND